MGERCPEEAVVPGSDPGLGTRVHQECSGYHRALPTLEPGFESRLMYHKPFQKRLERKIFLKYKYPGKEFLAKKIKHKVLVV